jgi:hypothetical protein
VAVESPVPAAQPFYKHRLFKRIPVPMLFVAAILVFGFLAPSIMGLALLALLVAIPLAVVAAIGWFLWKWVSSLRKPSPDAAPEFEPEEQTA